MNKIITIDDWLPAKGYANGVLDQSGTLYIGGQIGWNEKQEFVSDDFLQQMAQALSNIVTILEAAGGKTEDLTRMTWFVTDKAVYQEQQKEIGAIYRRIIGRHYPAMTLVVVAALLEPRAQIEIEATAYIGHKA